MIEELTIEEIATMIEIAQSIGREKKDELLDKLEEEVAQSESEGTVLSDGLIKELSVLMQKEMAFIETQAIPESEKMLHEAEDAYDDEMEVVRPEIVEMLDEYEYETSKLMEQNKKDYVELDKQLDGFLQGHKNKSEEAEIASIKQKLASKPSDS
jgi:hypothetical protein